MTETQKKFIASDIVDTYLFKNKMDRIQSQEMKEQSYAFLDTLLSEFPEIEGTLEERYGTELTEVDGDFEDYSTEELERVEHVDNVLNPQVSSLNKR